MPMSGSVLGTAIAGALDSGGYLGDIPASEIEAIWQLVMTEVITHIQTNGVVSGNGLPVLPVQVSPASGTGATTVPDVITGTIA